MAASLYGKGGRGFRRAGRGRRGPDGAGLRAGIAEVILLAAGHRAAAGVRAVEGAGLSVKGGWGPHRPAFPGARR